MNEPKNEQQAAELRAQQAELNARFAKLRQEQIRLEIAAAEGGNSASSAAEEPGVIADNQPQSSQGQWSSQALADSDAARRAELESQRTINRVKSLMRTRKERLATPRQVTFGIPAMVAIVVSAIALGSVLTFGRSGSEIPNIVVEVPGQSAIAGGSLAGLPSTVAANAFIPTDPLAPRICTLPGERTGEDDTLYNGTDPNRNLLPYSPFRAINFPCANFPNGLRATLLYRDSIVLLEGGAVLRAIPFDGAQTVALPDIVEIVNDPDWMVEVSEGIFQLDTALIQLGGTSLAIEAPAVNELRFSTRPDVFLGGRGAEAVIDGVRVTSWDFERGGPDENADDGRAFILYERGSRLDILNSEILYLGSDRSGAYGVSWRTGGTTGSSINTLYDKNWFGIYTFEARDLIFRGNIFSNNVYYGLDPHDYSYRLTVEDNVAFGNGSHGLIFSRGVVDSVMRNNHSYDNGGNGIVLDLESNRNLIEGNLVENNKKDGIVLLGSGDSQVINNTIRGNRTGIRLNQVGTTDVLIEGNILESNKTGIHAYGGAVDVIMQSNVIRNSSRAAIIADSGATSIFDTEISGAPKGIEARSTTQIARTTITDVDVGVVARDAGIVELQSSSIEASQTGVRLNRGTLGTIGSEAVIDAETKVFVPVLQAVWRTWLPFIGLFVLAVAVILEIVRGARTSGETDRLAPAGVLNIR